MNSTELFADWYRRAKLSFNADELNLRKNAISSLLKETDKSFWNDVIKIFLGLIKEDHENYKYIVNAFKLEDPTFPILQNNNLIKVLSGCLINFKVENDDSDECNFILATINSAKFNKKNNFKLFPEVLEISDSYLKDSQINSRITEDYSGPIRTNASNIANFKLPDWSEDTNYLYTKTIHPYLVSINKLIASLINEVNDLKSKINSLDNSRMVLELQNGHLSEELNVLWWVYGSFSNLMNSFFSKLEPQQSPLILSKELYSLTQMQIGLPSADTFLMKAIKNTTKPNVKVSLREIVDGTPYRIRQVIIDSSYKEDLSYASPCLSAIDCSVKVNEGDDWVPLFNKNTFGFDIDSKYDQHVISYQIYNEMISNGQY